MISTAAAKSSSAIRKTVTGSSPFIIIQIVNAVVMASLEFSLVVLTINAWAIFGILLIDFVIVTVSTLIPTIRYAKKQPIDIIQDKKNIVADNG